MLSDWSSKLVVIRSMALPRRSSVWVGGFASLLSTGDATLSRLWRQVEKGRADGGGRGERREETEENIRSVSLGVEFLGIKNVRVNVEFSLLLCNGC